MEADFVFAILITERDTDWLYFPIACSPYLLFPGEAKPLGRLCRHTGPLKLDIEHELVVPAPAGSGETSVKCKVKIPFSAIQQHRDSPAQEKISSFKLLKQYLVENEKKLNLPKNWQ